MTAQPTGDAGSALPQDKVFRGKLPFDLQTNEHIVLFVRRHWAYLYPKLILQALLGLVPIAVFTWLVDATTGISGTGRIIVAVIDLAWFVFWAIRCYFLWYRYNNDIWVVTNQRIIDSIKNNWFHHRMASADLVDVEDISVVKSGLLATAFDFGDVQCQTAGERPNFVLSGIPHPTHTLAVVDAGRDAARRELGTRM